MWVGAGVSAGLGQVPSINHSDDDGRTWSFSGPTFAWDFAFDGSGVWATTDDGLFLSEDQGVTWSRIAVRDANTGTTLFSPFVGIARAGPVLWIGANNGLAFTIDLPPPMYPHPELGCGC